jgi:predicted metal-dependent peptidase
LVTTESPHIAAGLYLPSVSKSGVGEIVIAVDTSGSIGQEELAQFASEITSMCDEAKPEGIHVVYCDAVVQSVQSFDSSEPIALEPKGGGGTDFKPVFTWVEEQQIEPVCLIYLTDLCCHSYPQIPGYPVLWVTDSRRTAPFGETIRMTEREHENEILLSLAVRRLSTTCPREASKGRAAIDSRL